MNPSDMIRDTELLDRAKASDYARRKQIAPVTMLDVVVMFFAGIVTTLVLAFIVGA